MDFGILHRNIPLMPPVPRMLNDFNSQNLKLAYRAKIHKLILRLTVQVEMMDRFQNNFTEMSSNDSVP